MASCNKSQPQVEAKSESKAPAELKIAYVEVDSIISDDFDKFFFKTDSGVCSECTEL